MVYLGLFKGCMFGLRVIPGFRASLYVWHIRQELKSLVLQAGDVGQHGWISGEWP